MITGLLRRIIRSGRVRRIALTSTAIEELARPYIVGTTPDEVLAEVRVLRSRGLEVGVAYLPGSDSESESPAALEALLEVFGDEARGLELSVTPSQLGLRRSLAEAGGALERLAGVADAAGALVTLEMQGHAEYHETLRLWRGAHASHPDLGITLPVDIRRAERDCRAIVDDAPRVRLCIGSYPVPRALGIRREHDKSRALVRCMRAAMESGATTLVASHDPTIVAIAQELHHRTSAPFEYQMFYGVRPLEQRRLADIGYRSRVVLPYGPGWFEYLTMRMAARPQTALGYLRALRDKR